jgi:hypothetical protein
MMTPGIGHNSLDPEILESRLGDWIALSRKVREHPVVGLRNPVRPADDRRGSCSRFEAWFDLLCLAQYRASKINNRGEVMTLDVGQLMGARAWLADRWNWTEKTVRVFLDTLEAEGMISRYPNLSAEKGQQNGQQEGQRRANKCNVITVCNYAKYQLLQDAIESYVRQLQGPPDGQRGASEGPARGHNLTSKTNKQLNTPLPPLGGEPKRKRSLRLWNETATRLGLSVCTEFSPSRRARMIRRLADIGGLEKLKIALSAIERVPFLMGQTRPRDGERPFRMTIDHLMQTNSNLGDVLAKLIDRAIDSADLVGPNGKRWGWWRGHEDNIRKLQIEHWRKLDAECKPNGTWPWWAMGPPPGHPECLMPHELLAERGYVEIYKGQINHA